MWTANKSRICMASFPICMLATPGFAVAQQEKQYLDAGKGQPPFDITRHSAPIEEILSSANAFTALVRWSASLLRPFPSVEVTAVQSRPAAPS
jgi:hypothetical protein